MFHARTVEIGASLKAGDAPPKQRKRPERKPGEAGLRAGGLAGGDGGAATARAERSRRSDPQELDGFAVERSREAGPLIA